MCEFNDKLHLNKSPFIKPSNGQMLSVLLITVLLSSVCVQFNHLRVWHSRKHWLTFLLFQLLCNTNCQSHFQWVRHSWMFNVGPMWAAWTAWQSECLCYLWAAPSGCCTRCVCVLRRHCGGAACPPPAFSLSSYTRREPHQARVPLTPGPQLASASPSLQICLAAAPHLTVGHQSHLQRKK